MRYSPSNQAFKFIHEDGSETSIKLSPSGSFDSSNLDRDNPNTEDKNKYSVIISCSKGCQMSCTFCHLTKLGVKFKPLEDYEVYANVKEALDEVFKANPEIATKYIKLCWMGMGEAILKPDMVYNASLAIINYALEKGYAAGIDGVDISTVYPKIGTGWMEEFNFLNNALRGYHFNPSNTEEGRTPLRMFYSLHHYNANERASLIPNTRHALTALDVLTDFRDTTGINLVIHYMFMKGINDSETDLYSLVGFMNTKEMQDTELRILRYNNFEDESESDRMEDIIKYLENNLTVRKFKVQYSSGEDISSACGQFLGEDINRA